MKTASPSLDDEQKGRPVVSVVMAVRNGERFVRSALDSVLRQSFDDLELIVVDDASTDGTRQIVESSADSRLRMVCNRERRGQTASLNIGLAMARGEFVARMDQDDVCHPARLMVQVDYLERHPDVALLGTGARVIDSSGQVFSVERTAALHWAIRWHLLCGNQFMHPTVMWRRDKVARLVGGYDEAFGYASDYEFFARVAHQCLTHNLSQSLLDYRRHEGAAGIEGSAADADAREAEASLVSARELRELFRGEPPVPASWLRAIGTLALPNWPPAAAVDAVRCFLVARDRFLETHSREGVHESDRAEISRHVRRCLENVFAAMARDGGDIMGLAAFLFRHNPSDLAHVAARLAQRAIHKVLRSLRHALDRGR